MRGKRENCSKYRESGKQGVYLITVIIILLCFAADRRSAAQSPTAADLYRNIVSPLLNPAEVHGIRHVAFDYEDLHLVLRDGTIALTQAVDGHVTGAIFEGEGEILLVPPNRAERTSLALFTQSGVLDEHFNTAYLRFVDDNLLENLRSGFRPAENKEEFVAKWREAMQLLAQPDGLQILQTLTNSGESASRFWHLRLAGTRLGIFDVFVNTSAADQIIVAQTSRNNDRLYNDIWAAFPARSARQASNNSAATAVRISDFHVTARIFPPSSMEGEAELAVDAQRSGQRTLILQLSRFLRVNEVKLNGQPVEFIQNEAVSGSEASRRGDDLVAVIFAQPLEKNHPAKLAVKYSGAVMFDAGADLLYVGARGTWYPNLGPGFANFDLTFEYPGNWTLAATGKQISSSTTANGRQTARFVSDKPIAHAGFNLGKFQTGSTSVGPLVITAYAASNVEQPLMRTLARNQPSADLHPDPAKMVQHTTQQAAATVQFLSAELVPFPYSRLEIAQLPALLSQSWPGLIYLSTMAFLTPQDRSALGMHDPYMELLFSELMLAHETAHQWWGDTVNSESYRDEWLIEALANYNALMMLERENPEKMHIALDYYAHELLRETPNGIVDDAGPVTLGDRLSSSKFPDVIDPVLYGRGTWMIHMLRTMLRQAGKEKAGKEKNDALFFKALQVLLTKSHSGKISTRDLQQACEQVMPPSLAYEGQKNLDWFFDGWVNGTSIPEFSIEDLHVAATGGKVVVSAVIHEKYAPKELVTAIPLYSSDEAGHSEFLGFVFADETKTDFKLDAPVGTKTVLLDPDHTVLRR